MESSPAEFAGVLLGNITSCDLPGNSYLLAPLQALTVLGGEP